MKNRDEHLALECEISEMIASLEERFDAMRRSVMERVRARLGALSVEQENAVESLTCAIVDKVLQAPLALLENAAADDEPARVLETARTIFGLRGANG